MSRCIITLAIGGQYPACAARLKASLDKTGYKGAYRAFSSYPPGCPTHQAGPYAFKPHAMKWAKESGFESVLWLDSSCWANKPIDEVFDKIEAEGYFVLLNGWSSGHWCSDKQLEAFNLTRDQAFDVPHPMGCMIGIKFSHPGGAAIYEDLFAHQGLFPGPWTNENGQASKDTRVLGTRHDQAVLGLIMHKHALTYTNPQYPEKDMGYIAYPPGSGIEAERRAIVLAHGDPRYQSPPN